jgi:hypothetical protein
MKGSECRIDMSHVSSSPAVKQTACTEMLVTNYHSMLYKIPKVCTSHLHCGRNLLSQEVFPHFIVMDVVKTECPKAYVM